MKWPVTLVVEGVGDVVQRYYAPTLQKLSAQGKVHVIFVDQSDYWRDDPQLKQRYKQFIAESKHWKAIYIDKSTTAGRNKYKSLKADAAFIATPDYTHVDIALHWLEPADRCRLLFVEKPLDASMQKARQLLSRIQPWDQKVRVLDHYIARVHPIQEDLILKTLYQSHRTPNHWVFLLSAGKSQRATADWPA